MTQNEEPSEITVMRRRRLRFRVWHRGMREVDLLLGRFADAHVDDLGEDDLAAFEALLDVPDPVVLSWVTEQAPIPAEMDSPLLRQVVAFHRNGPQQATK